MHIDTDVCSSYTCRHLAHKWSTTYIQPHTKRRLLPFMDTEIDAIEDLILLDLLGAPNPTIRSSFIETAWLFDAMVSAEQRLGESGAFNYNQQNTAEWKSFFVPRRGNFGGFGISDDHIPFLRLGVTILHVISSPFPHVWHTIKVRWPLRLTLETTDAWWAQDDATALDIPTMRRWNLILRVFMSEYLGLRPDLLRTRDTATEHLGRSVDDLVSGTASSRAHSSYGFSVESGHFVVY